MLMAKFSKKKNIEGYFEPDPVFMKGLNRFFLQGSDPTRINPDPLLRVLQMSPKYQLIDSTLNDICSFKVRAYYFSSTLDIFTHYFICVVPSV